MFMREPGFEPGLRAWEAPVITTTLFPQEYLVKNLIVNK